MVERLLADRLVACGQRVGPVVSRYWWQGALDRAEEWLVLLKTRAELATAVVDAVVAAHPYETPEVVVLDLVAATPGTWRGSTRSPDRPALPSGGPARRRSHEQASDPTTDHRHRRGRGSA